MQISKLKSIAYLAEKLFTENFKPEYNGNYTYSYDKEIFTEEQLNFLRNFEGKTLDTFLTNPTNFEKYDKTIVVNENDETITIADTFRRIIFHYLSYIIRENIEKFLDVIESKEFRDFMGHGISGEKNILSFYDVERALQYFKQNVTDFPIIESFLAIRRYWVINGNHHEVYKYKIKETLKTKEYNFKEFPVL